MARFVVSRAQLEALAHTLHPGEQRAVGGGVYVRLDKSQRLRFQYRVRLGGAQSPLVSGTFDSWDEAYDERRRILANRAEAPRSRRRVEAGSLPFEVFARTWLRLVELRCASLTTLNYRQVLERDVVPYWQGWRLDAITPLDVEAFVPWLVEQKTRPGGVLSLSACDRALDIFSRVLNYAVHTRALPGNPAENTQRLSPRRRRHKPNARVIRSSEVIHPRLVELIRGALSARAERALVTVLAYEGLRPGEALWLRHEHWRDWNGSRRIITVEGAVKDVAGRLEAGLPKTGEGRDVLLWPIVATELEDLYLDQGEPPLSSLVFPSASGDFMRWSNWRHRSWYVALHQAGIADGPTPTDRGAFPPRLLRHTCATLMLHAAKPGGGHYTVAEIARQLGHSPQTHLAVYAHLLDDQSDVSGRTMDDVIRRARDQVSQLHLRRQLNHRLVPESARRVDL